MSGKLSWNSIWDSWYEKLICFVGNKKTFHQTDADYNAERFLSHTHITYRDRHNNSCRNDNSGGEVFTWYAVAVLHRKSG